MGLLHAYQDRNQNEEDYLRQSGCMYSIDYAQLFVIFIHMYRDFCLLDFGTVFRERLIWE